MKKTIFFLLLSIGLNAQVKFVEFKLNGVQYSDAIMTDTLFTEVGIITDVKVSGFDVLYNGHEIKPINEPILTDGFIQLGNKAPISYIDLNGRVYSNKPKHTGWYVIKMKNIIHEVFIDDWGSFNAINGGL